jgi:uncharacterized protein
MAAASPHRFRRIFIGHFGLRAGWSLLIYIAIIVSAAVSVHAIQHHLRAQSEQSVPKAGTPVPDLQTPQPVRGVIIAEAANFVIFLIVSWLMARIERRKLSVFGLGGQRPLRRFFTGSIWGLASMTLLIASLCALHLLSFDKCLLNGASICGWGAAQLFAFFLIGLWEEYTFRGYIQFTLTRGLIGLGKRISPSHPRAIAFWIASCITSMVFFYAHAGNNGENKLGLLQIFLVGLVFVFALWRTGSLWWAIGFHLAWDWTQSFLYGVPDSGNLMQGRLLSTHASGNPLFSGGADGPEGSILCIPILLLVILVLWFTRRSPLPPLTIQSTK